MNENRARRAGFHIRAAQHQFPNAFRGLRILCGAAAGDRSTAQLIDSHRMVRASTSWEFGMRTWSRLFLAFCLCSAVAARGVQTQSPASEAPQIDKPRIDKIDPPDWWAQFPDPMLLVHGAGLNGARLSLSANGVTLRRSQESANGHWVFLWLGTRSAPPQTLWITASNDRGEARHSYVLAARTQSASGHSGFSSADTLYLDT
jgi:hypothetical protein